MIEKNPSSHARVIAFYLPQFHEIPENNAWWGQGFTEWTNVRAARPLFSGHKQPIVPDTLGYYDLTDPSVRNHQARLAKDHGLEGFCYWHYWFGNGRRILERPFDEVLSSGSPDFPFCLCWANQSWTGVWHGAPRRLLLEQTYPGEDDEKLHFDFLARAFQDPRYMTVSGCPIFLIYAPHELPDPVGLTKRWKRMALERDFRGLHLIAMSNDINHPSLTCFDQVMPFGPGDYLLRKPMSSLQRIVRRLAASPTGEFLGGNLRVLLKAPMRFDYKDVVDEAFASLPSASRYLPCVLSGWDNTPRSGRRGIVFNDCEPELFRLYVRKAVEFVKHRAPEERLVFIKAWNEWAEGNVLEPVVGSGLRYLEALRSEVST